jgi:SNF2 family DNA or RNA helicase
VERFQNDAREKIFLLSIKAGGTGLNLTAASHVMVYRLITQGTFEEKINAMLKEKKELAIIRPFYGFWLHLTYKR